MLELFAIIGLLTVAGALLWLKPGMLRRVTGTVCRGIQQLVATLVTTLVAISLAPTILGATSRLYDTLNCNDCGRTDTSDWAWGYFAMPLPRVDPCTYHAVPSGSASRLRFVRRRDDVGRGGVHGSVVIWDIESPSGVVSGT